MSRTLFADGPPLPDEIRPMLFAPFRGTGARQAGQGIGLGLYITRQLMVAHGGTLSYESSQSSGTCFTVCLPRHAQGPDNP